MQSQVAQQQEEQHQVTAAEPQYSSSTTTTLVEPAGNDLLYAYCTVLFIHMVSVHECSKATQGAPVAGQARGGGRRQRAGGVRAAKTQEGAREEESD